MIDFHSQATDILYNPRTPESSLKPILKGLRSYKIEGHVWLSTSGSTGEIKWAALSKAALLCSARTVNCHLQSVSSDIWLNPLPHFHVGGLGIAARAHLSGAKVVAFEHKWDPLVYLSSLTQSQATLSSLVPAQVYDLVRHNLQAPSHLRGLLIGGGALSDTLYTQARALGWPLLPTYGLTEASSQVATADLNLCSPKLRILPHMEMTIRAEQLYLKSPSLLSFYARFEDDKVNLFDPKDAQGGWLSEDRGFIEGPHLHLLGRNSNFVKIGGESVDLLRLEGILDAVRLQTKYNHDCALVALADERLGHTIHFVTTTTDETHVKTVVEAFKEQVLPYERIRQVHQVERIPRSPLNKLLRTELIEILKR